MLVDGLGCWIGHCGPNAITPGRPTLFLDRDEVLLADPGYLHCPSQVQLLEGAAGVVRWANDNALPAIVITNQSGIARGFFGWDEFHAVNRRMNDLLKEAGAFLDAVIACAWHEDGLSPLQSSCHPWRKPNPGMFFAAENIFDCQLSCSWMVGDRQSDIDAAYHAGLQGGLLIGATDYPDQRWPRENGMGAFAVAGVHSMRDALGKLEKNFNPDIQYSEKSDAF